MKTINREASDKSKGFRLQKLRAIELILGSIEISDSALIYSAIEYKEDVYLKSHQNGKSTETFEENKNYQSESTFSFNSKEVLKALISFIDIYLKYEKSKNVFFGFYSTNKIAKEKATEKTRRLKVKLPPNAILEYLCNKKIEENTSVVESIKLLVLNEYEKEYDGKKMGYYDVIKLFDKGDWIDFLHKIDWKIGQSDHLELEINVLKKIKESKFFNNRLFDKEKLILDTLMDLYDKRQSSVDLIEKLVFNSDVQFVFKNIESISPENKLNTDPTYEMWKKLEEPLDKRNIIEKVVAVCKDYNKSKMTDLARKIGRSKVETKNISSDKNFLAMKYRVYELCNSKLIELIIDNSENFNDRKINDWFNILLNIAEVEVNKLSNEYFYPLKNHRVIEGIILELFDDCFLALDNYE